MKKLFMTATLVASMAPAWVLAESASLTITGTIIPTSCAPAFAGGGVVDLGKISAATLNATTQTELPARNITLTVACNASAPLAIQVHDNKASTQLDGITLDGRAENMYIYGIGQAGTAKIGGYGLRHQTPTVDGVAATLMFQQMSGIGGPAWNQPSSTLVGKHGSSGGELRYSWGASVADGPAAGTVHTFPMSLVPIVGRGDALPTGSDITLDGSATFEMVYL